MKIIIIGGGPGGYETAIEAANKGHQVTLFERDALGGTCLNRGCIPTKALCRAAEVLDTVKEAADFGIAVDGFTADYCKAHSRMLDVVKMLRDGVEASMAMVEVIKAEASINPDGSVEADGETYHADKVIIATGSKPASLPIPGAEYCMTSDHLLQASTLPKSIVVIGGGVIGMEFASIMCSYGVEVTVVEYCKEILPPFDPDIAKRLRTAMGRRGVKFVVGAGVTGITRSEEEGCTVTYTGKKGEMSIQTEAVLMATGRRPVMPEGLEAAGIEFSPKGIKVDPATMETTRPGVYAIGDCNGLCMLAHAATAQGRVVLGEKVNLDVIPSAVFTRPEVAMVRNTRDNDEDKDVTIQTHTVMYGTSGKAVAMGEPFGVVKLVVTEPENGSPGRVLSASILGAHASDLIQEVATVMANGLGVDAIADTVHAHPTLCELVMNAAR